MPRYFRISRTITGRLHLLLLVFLAILPGICSAQSSTTSKYLAYVGTYTDHSSKGIYAYHFDSKTGRLTSIGLAAVTDNPTFLALDPRRKFLYAANEIPTYNGQPTGAVSAFAIDPK